jgi:hypothetical protein
MIAMLNKIQIFENKKYNYILTNKSNKNLILNNIDSENKNLSIFSLLLFNYFTKWSSIKIDDETFNEYITYLKLLSHEELNELISFYSSLSKVGELTKPSKNIDMDELFELIKNRRVRFRNNAKLYREKMIEILKTPMS